MFGRRNKSLESLVPFEGVTVIYVEAKIINMEESCGENKAENEIILMLLNGKVTEPNQHKWRSFQCYKGSNKCRKGA